MFVTMLGQYEVILASRKKTFKQLAAHGDLFITLFLFFTFSPLKSHVKFNLNL